MVEQPDQILPPASWHPEATRAPQARERIGVIKEAARLDVPSFREL